MRGGLHLNVMGVMGITSADGGAANAHDGALQRLDRDNPKGYTTMQDFSRMD